MVTGGLNPQKKDGCNDLSSDYFSHACIHLSPYTAQWFNVLVEQISSLTAFITSFQNLDTVSATVIRDFGYIEVAVKQRQNIYSLDEYCDLVMKSNNKPCPIITTMAAKMCDILV